MERRDKFDEHGTISRSHPQQPRRSLRPHRNVVPEEIWGKGQAAVTHHGTQTGTKQMNAWNEYWQNWLRERQTADWQAYRQTYQNGQTDLHEETRANWKSRDAIFVFLLAYCSFVELLVAQKRYPVRLRMRALVSLLLLVFSFFKTPNVFKQCLFTFSLAAALERWTRRLIFCDFS